MATTDQIRRRIQDWARRPVEFVERNFGVTPDHWQREALEASVAGGPAHRVVMRACTGPGKSAVLAWIGWHRLLCFGARGEHPKGAALSITKENLSDNLWAELSKWQQRSEILKAAFVWTKSLIYAADHPETWFLSARSFAQNADAEAIGRTLSGLHSEFPFILLDEIGDMPRAVGRAAEQVFTGNPKDALVAAAGNPTAIDGLLYDVVQRLRALWKTITVTADPDDPNRTPRVSREHARQQIELYGRDNPWVMATILGQFPPGGFNNLLTLDDVERAMHRFYRPEDYRHAPKIIGVDVAREGDDQSVIIRRQGLQAWKPKTFRNIKSVDLCGWVAQVEDDWAADGVIVDGTGGYGASLLDALEQLNRKPWDCQFAGKADNPKYYNKRAEIWYEMAEWIKNGGAIPDAPGFLEELTQTKYGYKRDQILIEPKEELKKRIGRSPDTSDSLAVTFAFRITPREETLPTGRTGRRQQAESWSPYDAM